MTELEFLCVELNSGDDARAEQAAINLPRLGTVALPALRTMLKAADADERWWAVRTLVGFEADIIQDLLAALEDISCDVRQAAAMAFCHRRDPRAVLPLIRALDDPDPMTAKLAANALILAGPDATTALLDVVITGSQSARLEAVRALSEIKDTRAIPGLMKALETDSALMQYWAGLGLDKLGVGMVYLKPD